MSGLSRFLLKPSPDCVHEDRYQGSAIKPGAVHVTLGIVVSAVLCASFSLISLENPQTIGSGLGRPQLHAAARGQAMKDVFAKLGTDFLSTIVFLALYLITGNVVRATSVAIPG